MLLEPLVAASLRIEPTRWRAMRPPGVRPGRWVSEFSRYDAGWLHDFPNHNGGDLLAATWDDVRGYPLSRISPS